MAGLPQSLMPWRMPRAHLEANTPAVLRFPSGQRVGALVRVISATGGLLAVPQPLVEGSRVKLMFLTNGGSIFGGAELLSALALQSSRGCKRRDPRFGRRRLFATARLTKVRNAFFKVCNLPPPIVVQVGLLPDGVILSSA